jgi:hypothetical protein
MNGGDNIVVWLDYNNKGNFADAGERIYYGPVGAFTHTSNITISSAASVVKNIPLRMRVAGWDNWKTDPTDPCINNIYNEIEDYAVMIVTTPALPVEIVSFNATIESPVVRLNWITANEKDLSHFIIEKTSSGSSLWEQVDLIKARGEHGLSNYITYDQKPGTGIVYYRLTAIDKNGAHSYSKIIHVNLDGKYNYTISPNPTSDIVNVFSNTNVAVNDNNLLVIRNMTGQEVKRVTLHDQFNSFSVKELPAGLYTIEIYSEGKLFFEKLVKQ